MKKSILRAASLAAIAALISIGCNDNSTASPNNDGRADDFVNEFNGKADTASYKLAIDVAPAEGGNITRNPSKTSYKAGETVTVTATAKTDYRFTCWTGSMNDTTAAMTIIMDNDLTLKANFISTLVPNHTLNISLAPNGSGMVSRYPNKIVYSDGDTVTVTAAATDTYMFTGWSGALNDTAAATTMTIKKDLWLTANFIPKSATHYTVTVNTEPDSGGHVTIFPNRTAYIPGDSVTVMATAASGYIFTGWTGALTSAETYIQFAVTRDMSLTANFQKSDAPPSGMTFIDTRDGTVYKKVMIGDQMWMAENLNYDTDDSKCYGNSADSCAKYGRLYDWNTAMNGAPSSSSNPSGVQGVCPDGWHIPSDAEWTMLMDFVGATTTGTKLKSSTGWGSSSSVPVGTNEYGWLALPGGGGNSDGDFYYAGYLGLWWSATEGNASYAWSRGVSYDDEGVGRLNYVKTTLFSVRCVQDGLNSSTYTLTTGATPTTGGSVSPATATHTAGSTVTVTATPALGYEFTGWTGTGAPTPTTTNPVTVTMNSNLTLTAMFVEQGTYGRGISENRIYVDGVQVYNRSGSAIDYTGSFTTFSLRSSEPKLTDYFTDPVVNVVNGKLTIDLGEPKILRPVTSFTIRSASDPTANMLVMSEMYNEDDSAMLVPTFGGESVFFYVDKPVTVTTIQNMVLSLRKGWNFVIGEATPNGDYPLNITSTVDLYGSGNRRWRVIIDD